MNSLDPDGSRRSLFEKSSKTCLPIGSVLEVEMWDDPPDNTSFQTFAGHMIAVRRRGIDTSFRLRSIVSRIGVEQVFKLFATNIKTIRIVHRGALRGRRYKRAKLFFTRKLGTRNTLGSVENVVKKAKQAEWEAKAEMERLLEKKGKGKAAAKDNTDASKQKQKKK